MEVIYKEKDKYVKEVKIECSPAEYLIINQAMRLYMENDYVNETDRGIMRRMLKVDPVFEEVKE